MPPPPILLFLLLLPLPTLSRPTSFQILFHSNPPPNLTHSSLHPSSLPSLGFIPAPPTHPCTQLLSPEFGSHLLNFPPHLACVRLQHPHPLNSHTLPLPPSSFIPRDKVHLLCNGHCTAYFSRTSLTLSTFYGTRFIFRPDLPLFRQLPPPATPWSSAHLVVLPVAFSLFLLILLLLRPASSVQSTLGLLLVVIVSYASLRDTLHPRYLLRLRPASTPGRSLSIRDFHLFNVSQETIRAHHPPDCVIYTCNAYADVVNLRVRSRCDQVNFRVLSVARANGRSVAKNWLKVLLGIWLVEQGQYARFVYIDRDVILTEDPMRAFEGGGARAEGMTFADLGGGKGDAAMFGGGGKGTLRFLEQWLEGESGGTGRRDGGEEQEVLLGLDTAGVRMVAGWYGFQCGRNAMNRAQCLMQRRWVEWNKELFFVKVAVEVVRSGGFSVWGGKGWMPMVMVHGGGGWGGRQGLVAVVGAAEVVMYGVLFRGEGMKERRCAAAGVKSISYGSVDNPFEGTLTSVFEGGIAKRGAVGWKCYEMGRYWERWTDSGSRLNDVWSFVAAQVTVVALGVVFGMRHLLNPLQNLQMVGTKKD